MKLALMIGGGAALFLAGFGSGCMCGAVAVGLG